MHHTKSLAALKTCDPASVVLAATRPPRQCGWAGGCVTVSCALRTASLGTCRAQVEAGKAEKGGLRSRDALEVEIRWLQCSTCMELCLRSQWLASCPGWATRATDRSSVADLETNVASERAARLRAAQPTRNMARVHDELTLNRSASDRRADGLERRWRARERLSRSSPRLSQPG